MQNKLNNNSESILGDVIRNERRKPVNIATVNNHDAECLRRIAAAGLCTCGRLPTEEEVEAAR